MTLDELLNTIGAQNDDRNGVQNAGVYVPPNTTFTTDYLPGAPFDGMVTPFMSNTARINNGNFLDKDNDPDMIHYLYTALHEAAHTAQQPTDMFLSMGGLGSTSKLNGNQLDSYPDSSGKPNSLESLATLRGMEGMLPTGRTIWNMPGEDTYSQKDVERYLQDTMQKNNLSREGAQRLIDTKMFPDHSVMHGTDDFTPANGSPSALDQVKDRITRFFRK